MSLLSLRSQPNSPVITMDPGHMNMMVSHTATSQRLNKHIELHDQALDPTMKRGCSTA